MTSGYRTIAERIDFMSRRHADRGHELIELERHMIEAEIDRLRALNALIAAIGTKAVAERFGVSGRTVRRWRNSSLNKIGQKMSA
jgi:hypothetical protein